jgi:hypothetical protein
LVSYLFCLQVKLDPKIPYQTKWKLFQCGALSLARSPWDQLKSWSLATPPNGSTLLLLAPKYCLKVLTAFSPPYSFWMKWKLILPGLVRTCVRFPHPTITVVSER